jgi:hypothetical protein
MPGPEGCPAEATAFKAATSASVRSQFIAPILSSAWRAFFTPGNCASYVLQGFYLSHLTLLEELDDESIDLVRLFNTDQMPGVEDLNPEVRNILSQRLGVLRIAHQIVLFSKD